MNYDATTEPPESFEALKRRLIEIEPHLPKRLRQAAAYALEHPDEFALGTASALARSADVQASTLVRFAQTLGFAGFSDLQEVFRWRLRNRWPDYSERLRALQQNARDSGDPTHLLFGFADSAAASIARLREGVQRRELDRAVGLLARARTIHCLGQRRSFCVAHYLTYALSQLGIPASLIDNVGGLGPEQLARAGAGRRADRHQLLALFALHGRPRQAGAARRRSDRRRHRQRALAARRPRRRPLRDRRKRLRLVSFACGDVLPGHDARCGSRGKAGGSGGLRVLLGKRPPGREHNFRHERRGHRDKQGNCEHRNEGEVERLFKRRSKRRIADRLLGTPLQQSPKLI